MNEETEITESTYAEAWVHLQEGPIEPLKVQVVFSGYSFKHMSQVLLGDAHPRKVAFIVFGHIEPSVDKAGFIIDCEGLTPIFEFGHELSGLRS